MFFPEGIARAVLGLDHSMPYLVSGDRLLDFHPRWCLLFTSSVYLSQQVLHICGVAGLDEQNTGVQSENCRELLRGRNTQQS